MATWTTTVTNKGIELQSKQVLGATISFTRVVSGSGSVPVVNLKEQTSISNIKSTLTVENLKVKGSEYVISTLLSNKGLESEYNLSQIGIYANDPGNGEILFAIAQIDTPKKIPSETSSPGYNIEFAFTFKNDNGTNIVITPDVAGYMTRGQVEELLDSMIELGDDITE